MLTALFGIEDGSLNLAINLVILVLVVVWLSLVYWTWADARRRISDPVVVGTATLVSLIPFIGTVIYTILRPPEFLVDSRERELEVQASELRLRHLTAQSCPRCEHPIERTWLRCPECQQRLKDPCRSCSRPVDPRWSICPYCETPMSSSPRREGHRRSKEEGGADAKPTSAADRVRSESSRGAAERTERPPRSERERPQRSAPRSGPSASSQPAPGATGSDPDPASASSPRRRSTTTS